MASVLSPQVRWLRLNPCFVSSVGWWHPSLYHQPWLFPWAMDYVFNFAPDRIVIVWMSNGCPEVNMSISNNFPLNLFSLACHLSKWHHHSLTVLDQKPNLLALPFLYTPHPSHHNVFQFYLQCSLWIETLSRWEIRCLDYSDRCVKNRWLATREENSPCTFIVVRTLPQTLLQSALP